MENFSLHEKLASLGASYMPEWKRHDADRDAGSALARLLEEMLTESDARADDLLAKNRIEYLNLFDSLVEQPNETARSFVRFTPVANIPEPAFVPANTELFADDPAGSGRITFATSYGITVSEAAPALVMVSDRKNDRIARLYGASDGSPESCSFFAFDSEQGDDLGAHRLTIGFKSAFEGAKELDFSLRVVVPEGRKAEEAASLLCGEDMSWSILEPDENEAAALEQPFDRVTAEGDLIHLEKSGFSPRQCLVGGERFFLIRLSAEKLRELEILSLELVRNRSGLAPELVSCNGVPQLTGRIKPFGAPMEIFSECQLENREALSQRGAEITLSFELDFERLEQSLPELEVDEQTLKLVMKKPVERPHFERREIKADYVLTEYLSLDGGWKRLMADENAALLFNGSAKGKISLSFFCPEDIADQPEDEQGGRLRLRLMRADNLYLMPSLQMVPVIEGLEFAYSYDRKPFTPQYAETLNHFESADITELLRRKRRTELFYSREAEGLRMYIGYDSSPFGSPLSLYLDIENRADHPLPFTAEYLSPGGFEPLRVIDSTGSLRFSGNLLLLVPGDVCRQSLFGEELFWIRLNCLEPGPDRFALPLIKGMYTNMARVENRRVRSDFFYIDDPSASFIIELEQSGLYSMEVFVNELSPDREENWVRWERRRSAEQRGRFYTADLAEGKIEFEKNIFATYPYNPTQASVRVDYTSYAGSAANLPSNSIVTLGDAIPYISSVTNPVPALGGIDLPGEAETARRISALLRTRKRAVSARDYADIIESACCGVNRVRCMSDIDEAGRPAPGRVTVAILIDNYAVGGHLFSTVRERVLARLGESAGLAPLGKQLAVVQPNFLPFSVRLWLTCPGTEAVYDLQREAAALISRFLDPLEGGFEGRGYEIGELPTPKQLLAFLKKRLPQASVKRLMVTASYNGREYLADDDIQKIIDHPFAMAIDGGQTVYVDIEV